MTLKPWIIGSFFLIGVAVNGVLIYRERLAPTQKVMGHTAIRSDPLIDLKFTPATRVENFKLFGLDEEAAKATADRTRDLDTEENRARIEAFFNEMDDPDRAADAFCGISKVPSRYMALAYLVKDERGQRDALELGRVSKLEREQWALTARIAEVYEEVELGSERQHDATIMGVAALLLGREQDAIERNSPWGVGLGGRWSWAKVVKENPGIQTRVQEYLALYHLTMEVVTAEGGFCTR